MGYKKYPVVGLLFIFVAIILFFSGAFYANAPSVNLALTALLMWVAPVLMGSAGVLLMFYGIPFVQPKEAREESSQMEDPPLQQER